MLYYGTQLWEMSVQMNKRYNDALENDIKIGKVKRIIIKDFDPMHPSEGTVEYTE